MQISDSSARAETAGRLTVICLIRDPDVRAVVVRALEDGGCRIARASSAVAPRAVLVDRTADISFARHRFGAPVVAVGPFESSREAENAMLCGADDYVPVDVSPASLRARIVARADVPHAVLTFEDLILYRRERILRRGARRLSLTDRESRLMVTFMARPYACHATADLIDTIWRGANVKGGTVQTFICFLRRKLNAGGEADLIETVRGIGYRLRSPDPPPRCG